MKANMLRLKIALVVWKIGFTDNIAYARMIIYTQWFAHNEQDHHEDWRWIILVSYEDYNNTKVNLGLVQRKTADHGLQFTPSLV